MDIFIGVVVGLLVLMLLVTLHEFGHFLVARKNGVNVLEFGIGFPPRAKAWIKDEKTGKWRKLPRSEWKKDKISKVVYSETKNQDLAQKGMVFSLNWLPIGGFCQMDGESAEDSRKGTFGNAGFWAKTKVLFAGVAMNWLVAALIFTILAWTGMPEFLEGQFTIPSDTRTESTPVEVVEVAEDSPAGKAGIVAGDLIIAVDGHEFLHASEITDYNEAHAGEEVFYTIRRENVSACCGNQTDDCEKEDCQPGIIEYDTAVTLNSDDSDYLLGVSMATTQSISYSTWSAPIVGAGLTLQLTGETFKGVGIVLWDLISGIGSQFSFDANIRESGKEAISSVGDSVSGPIGIIGVLFPAFTAAGPSNLAFLAALISVSLACMNILPIPALDGGRWLLIAIYKLRGKKLTKEVEEKVVSRAFMILLALIFIVTILDIIRLAQ
ncbi:site-2 protease family protein [Candidatus Saccharibacteria bacterium]|nr:site-2 protease family protein [Candidatus Saccharibacteria bacterium]